MFCSTIEGSSSSAPVSLKALNNWLKRGASLQLYYSQLHDMIRVLFCLESYFKNIYLYIVKITLNFLSDL